MRSTFKATDSDDSGRKIVDALLYLCNSEFHDRGLDVVLSVRT